uniref:Reverse transcriptase domain, reverse transcriptase zinc-binding domain protein n=1 Tax=Tanacetum cinerariifolium TaxID=118510 RepID=A0A6L2JCT0_TANCI|nr:reverse transcriptase domain, reverse transcriptase zinc-binding domain protein [Tanacetum cinerariifolium]
MVRSMWLFKHKFYAGGTLSRYNARLVANGSSQQLGVYFDETFSPVVKPATVRTVLSLAVSCKWPIHQLDVKNTFLNGVLSETVYMHQPPGFVDNRQGSQVAYLLTYVDDIILTASCPSLLQQIIGSLNNEFDMTDRGVLNYFLESKLGPKSVPVQDPTLYRNLPGGLPYLTFTRPDLSYAVQQICLYMHDPKEPQFAALKRILRYVRGTVNFGLQLYVSATISLVGYTDADWAGCPSTRRHCELHNDLVYTVDIESCTMVSFSPLTLHCGLRNGLASLADIPPPSQAAAGGKLFRRAFPANPKMFPVTRSIRSHTPLSTTHRPASITPTYSRLPSPPPSRHLLATPPAATPCLGYLTSHPPHHHSRPTNLPPSPPPTPRNATTDPPPITSQPPLATVKAKMGVCLAVISTERVRLDLDSAQGEGFVDVKLHYVGGLWVWIQFTSVKSCEAFKLNESLKKLWTFIKVPSPSFVVDKWVIWIEVNGLPLCAWGSSAFKKIANLFAKFNFFDEYVEDSMCMGSACITTKIQSLISEKERRSTDNEDVDPNEALDDFVQQNIKKEAGDGEIPSSEKAKDEYIDSNESKPFEEAVSDTSKPPGFENFTKENNDCSISSNASRSVGGALDYDVKGCKKSPRQMINGTDLCFKHNIHILGVQETMMTKLELFQLSSMLGNFKFDYVCSMARGRFGSLVTMWDPNVFMKMRMWCGDNHIIVEDEELAFDEDKATRISRLQELDNFEKMESLDLMQKARVKWEVEGDENSKFFHGLTNSRRKSQSIHGIMHEGVWLSDPKDIKEAFLNFYKDKFSCHDSQISFPSFIHAHHLNTSERDLLEAVVYMDEIKMADLLKHDIQEFVVSFFSTGMFPQGVNSAFITLIPKAVKIGSSNIQFPHLFYVDDVIIPSEWNQNNLEKIIRILNVFYIASGLKINFYKSNVFGVGVSHNEIVSMAACTGCEAGSFPFSYLGLPIGLNMSRIANWQVLIDPFKARMSGWKANLLSICGHLTLIKSVLGSLGIYFFSIFKVPEMVIRSLESVRATFFWGGHENSKKLSWVKWSNTLASFDKGGLGVGSLNAFNKALSLKWRWRLFNYPNALWVQVIKAFHGKEAAPFVLKPITMGITKTKFDNLILDIANMETDDLADFDSCIWSLSNDDSFSVNMVRKHIDECTLPTLSPCTRWYKMIPRKVNIFMWRMFLDRLPNRLNLSSRGLDLDSISCMVCNGSVNRMHTLFSPATRLLLFGVLFVHELVFLSQAFSRVKIGSAGLIHGSLLRTKRLVFIPSARPLVGLFAF